MFSPAFAPLHSTVILIVFLCISKHHSYSSTFLLSQRISFEITARNRLVDTGVDFEFALERPKNFDYIGADCFQWRLDNGGDELIIPMEAILPTPGVFNLQQIRLSVMKDDKKKIPYLFPLQWMVTVNDNEA